MSTDANLSHDGSPIVGRTATRPLGDLAPRSRRRWQGATVIVAVASLLAAAIFAQTRPDHSRPADVAAGSSNTTVSQRDSTTATSTSSTSTTTPDTTADPAVTSTVSVQTVTDPDTMPSSTTPSTTPPSTTTTVPEPMSMTGQVFYAIADAATSVGTFTVQGINRMSLAGGPETRVVDSQLIPQDLSVDGKWLVGEVASRDGAWLPIAYTRADGLGPVVQFASGYMRPVWSPDANRIAALSFLPDSNPIDILDRSGNIITSYLPPPGDQPGWRSVDWSPDGRLLVALDNEGLYTIDTATGSYQQLVAGSVVTYGQSADMAVSPDGTTIAYFDGGNLHLLAIATGTDTTIVTGTDPTVATGARGPHWSPDGQSIMASYIDGYNAGHMQLMRIPTDSSPAQLLTSTDRLRMGSAC